MHYLLIPYTIIAILFMFFYTKKDENIFRFAIIFLLSVSILFLGSGMIFQPLQGDSFRYNLAFQRISFLTFEQMLILEKPEFGFRFISWFTSNIINDVKFFFFTLYILFVVVCWKALKNLYESFETYIVFSFLILYPYFLFYIVNGKRQGIALVLMVLAISFIFKNKNVKAIISLAIAFLFHSSIVLTYPIFLFIIFFKNSDKLFKMSLIILSISIISSIIALNEQLSLLSDLFNLDARYTAYFDDSFSEIAYKTGFRLDFTLFSLFPLMLYFLFRKQLSENNEKILIWLSLYILLNSIYHFFSFVVFSDRFAIFSWFILPIVCYEILKKVNEGKYLPLFIFSLIFINVLLLQTYTGKILLELEIF